jgi:hypothetical protein
MKLISTEIQEISATDFLVTLLLSDADTFEAGRERIAITVEAKVKEAPVFLIEVQGEALDRALSVLEIERAERKNAVSRSQ